MKKIIAFCTVIAFVFSAQSQSKKDILLTVEDTPVYKQEFLRVYKKNLDLVKDESQKSVDGYLDLFVDYKLKVQEAYAQELDKDPAYVKEYKKYRAQLSRNYLFEEKIEEDMAREAYERLQEQINAQHVLIKVGYDALPQDTLQAYNKAREVREKAIQGADFSSLVMQYSEEPGAKERKGNLGYFTAFSMVYPFETAAYNTEVGKISKIARTSFGYHVIKILDRRPTGKEITVSHIMVAKKEADPSFNAEERIGELYQLLQQGQNFEAIAKQFSDDKNSGISGGKLKPFTKGKLRSPKFEDAAFALKAPGEISKPVQSEFGWHIIRLESFGEKKTYEAQRERLLAQGNRGERLMVVTSEIRSKIKEKYGFKGNKNHVAFFNDFVDKDILKRRWTYDAKDTALDPVIFTIGDRDVYYRDFAAHLEDRHKTPLPRTIKTKEAAIQYMYEDFERVTLQDYFRDKLEEENTAYASVINEYRDGLLIFEVMQRNIWDVAKSDTLALQKYFNANAAKYTWGKRLDATLFTSNERAALVEAKTLLDQNKTPDEVKEILNIEGKIRVLLSKGVYEEGAKQLPNNVVFALGVSEIYAKDKGFVLVQTNEVLPEGPKTLDEVKGNVVSEYQKELEVSWMKGLRDKYTVKINKKALRKIKKELK